MSVLWTDTPSMLRTSYCYSFSRVWFVSGTAYSTGIMQVTSLWWVTFGTRPTTPVHSPNALSEFYAVCFSHVVPSNNARGVVPWQMRTNLFRLRLTVSAAVFWYTAVTQQYLVILVCPVLNSYSPLADLAIITLMHALFTLSITGLV